MKLVIKKTGDEYTLNDVPVSDAAVRELLFTLFESPQLDECVRILRGTGELVLELNHAETVAANAVRKATKDAMYAILDANKRLSQSAAELLKYC